MPQEQPQQLRPYLSHKVELKWNGTNDAQGNCPFCDSSKFFVSQSTGQYDCKVCGEVGNAYTFIRKLHEVSQPDDSELELIAQERGLRAATLVEWGFVKSGVSGDWMLPTYGIKTDKQGNRQINNLYRWVRLTAGGKRRLIGTSNFNHGLFGFQFWSADKPSVYVCEGPWDAMRLWEELREKGLLQESDVVAVPGCETFRDEWPALFKGKEVTLLYDSDHPKVNEKTQKVIVPAGFAGAKSAARKLSHFAQSVHYLEWGPEGYDSTLPSGYDLRDFLNDREFQDLLSRIRPVPPDWLEGGSSPTPSDAPSVEAIPCESYAELVDAWKDTRDEEGGKEGALHWTDSIDVTLSCMLAIIVSTKMQGSQTWLRVIGPAGSVKSTLCEAISACSEYVFPMSMQTGFHSGYSANGEDNSLISRIKDKTVVINEGDMLLTASNRDQTLAELRDLYTGVTRAHYRNGKHYEHKGLRVTFILAGTPSLRKLNRSSLGDRFLDCVVYERKIKGAPDHGELKLLDKVGLMQLKRCKAESNCDPSSQDDPNKIHAIRMTAGFVKHLREQGINKASAMIDRLMESATSSKVPAQVTACRALAQLTAYMRTRPDKELDADETEVELATRLLEQYIRLSVCLSIVLDRHFDAEVLRRVARVAYDTCRGRSLKVCLTLHKEQQLDVRGISMRCGISIEAAQTTISLLLSIGCVKADTLKAASGAVGRNKHVYRLTPQMRGLLSTLQRLLGEETAQPV